jgi:hypothetical protein
LPKIGARPNSLMKKTVTTIAAIVAEPVTFWAK